MRNRRIGLFASGVGLLLSAHPAYAHHRARLDPTEPFFTQRAFLEKDAELDTAWDDEGDGNGVELAPGVSWVFGERIELDLEIPVGFELPDRGADVGSLGDVATGAQVQLCDTPNRLLDYCSVRLDVAAPSGSRSKNIGGTGSWALSLLPGRLFTIAQELPDLFVQAQLGYGEALRPAAAGAPREKSLAWNLALAQAYVGGRVGPVLELLGTSILDAASGEEGTIVEMAAGLWLAPFADEGWLSPLSIGLSWKWPLTTRRESELTGLLVLQWAYD